jgi:hypothetical protein
MAQPYRFFALLIKIIVILIFLYYGNKQHH